MATQGYLGNANLKKPGTPIEYTPEMLKEYIKCAKDPIYFAKNYIKIVHVDKGIIPFDMYEYQEEIVEKISNNRRVVVNQSRQSGKTTTAVAVILHYILFEEYKTAAILSNKGDSAKDVLSRIKLAYEKLPKWMQHGILEWNKHNIELENGCKVVAGTTSSSTIRGSTIAFLYIDECAFIEGYEEFFRSVYPTISSGKTTKMLMTSTPNGLNHFWKIWEGAINEKNGYEYVEVKWDRVPGRDADWKNETLQAINFDYESFEQEYNCSFMGSTSTLLKSQTLRNLTFDYPMVETEGISQYEKPQPNHQYVATVDVSQGKGLDYSTISIFDISTLPYKQVCTFRDNMISAMDFSPLIFRLCTFYNNAQLLIEVNDTGVMVAETLLMDLGYEELLFTENSGRHGKRISGGFSANKVDKGLRTSKTTKAKGCSILKMLIEQEQLIIRDYHTISELSRFVKRGASYQAEVGYHDDMVMTLVNFAWLTEQQYFKDLTDIDTAQALREKTDQQWEDELLPLGFNNAGGDVHSLMHPNEEIVEWNK